MTELNTDSTKKWYVIHYQLINERRLVDNLINQNFSFYIPKFLLLQNKQVKSTPLFPGYGFVQSTANQITALNYTKGLKYVLRNGPMYSHISDSLFSKIQEANQDYQTQPLTLLPKLNSDATMLNGPFKGNLVKVMGFSKANRVKILFNLLGRNVLSETPLDNLAI